MLFVFYTGSEPALTLSGGAPASDGAPPEGRQWGHPDINGSDELIEDEWVLQLQQSHVIVFGPSVVAMMVDDHQDSDHLDKNWSSYFLNF